MRWERRALVALCLVALFAMFGLMFHRVAERGRFVRAYSTYGAGADGTRALFLLAERMGGQPIRWSEDLARLPEAGGMLVALGSCESGMARPLSRFEQRDLGAWVKRGGVLVVAGARHYVPDGLGVHFEPEPDCAPGWRVGSADADADEAPEATPALMPASGTLADADLDTVWATPAAPPLQGLEAIPLQHPGRLMIDASVNSTALLTLPDAPTMPMSQVVRVAGVMVPHGRGRVIALASASLFQNKAIATTEGAPVFARLLRAYAPRGPVLFDEYHLGVGERRSFVRYLRQRGATTFLFPIAFAVLIALWRGGARFGAVRVVDDPPAGGTASFVSSLGRLFERTNDPAGAVDLLRRQALARIARHHHLPLGTARALVQTLRRRGAPDAATAVERIDQAAGALGRERGDLVGVARRIDRLAAAACG